MRSVHECGSTTDAYDHCQCNDSFKNGDTLHIPSEKVVGIVDTWPLAITKEYGALHTATPGKLRNVLTEPYVGRCMGLEPAIDAIKFAKEQGYELSKDAEEIYNAEHKD
jgi:hypothetical protein